MTDTTASRVASDERVMAALAHCLGLFGALIVWALQKDKSHFVRFQALQALAFGLLAMIFNLLLMLCLFGVALIGAAGALIAALRSGSSPDSILPLIALPGAFPLGAFACIFPLTLVISAVQLFAGASVASGHDFRYPWIASRVEAFLAD